MYVWKPIYTAPDELVLMWMRPRDWLPGGAVILDRPPPVKGYPINLSSPALEFRAFPLETWAREMGITHWMPLPSPPNRETE